MSCTRCQGTGQRDDNTDDRPCPNCLGDGHVTDPRDRELASLRAENTRLRNCLKFMREDQHKIDVQRRLNLTKAIELLTKEKSR